jgi:AcrR family transcriptional regulator
MLNAAVPQDTRGTPSYGKCIVMFLSIYSRPTSTDSAISEFSGKTMLRPVPQPSRLQRRGNHRREQLVRAAGELIVRLPLSEVTYAAICARAKIPPSSAYYFYPDLDAICRAILVSDRAGMDDALVRPFTKAQSRTWQSVVGCLVERAARYNRTHPVAAKLAIGGQTPPHLKRVDREADRVRSRLALRALEQLFVLPRIRRMEQVAFLAIELGDAVFTASMIERGRLTAGYVTLAKAAVVGFLTQFFGERLPPRRVPLRAANGAAKLVRRRPT